MKFDSREEYERYRTLREQQAASAAILPLLNAKACAAQHMIPNSWITGEQVLEHRYRPEDQAILDRWDALIKLACASVTLGKTAV